MYPDIHYKKTWCLWDVQKVRALQQTITVISIFQYFIMQILEIKYIHTEFHIYFNSYSPHSSSATPPTFCSVQMHGESKTLSTLTLLELRCSIRRVTDHRLSGNPMK